MKSKKTQKSTNTKHNKKMFYERIYQKYINPFTDFGFKKLFGQECNKELLLDFLNELLYEEQGRIVSISYLKLEQLGFSENSRRAIFDIYCENEKGEKFIVELQKTDQNFFKDRTVYYSTFPIVQQAPKGGEWNYELKAVYVIAILGFVFEDDEDEPEKYRYDVKLTDIVTHKVFYDKLTFIYLAMPKFNKELDQIETHFEKWMFLLKNLKNLDDHPDEFREYIFERLFEAAEVAKLSQTEYLQYVENIKNIRDWNNCFDTALSRATVKATEKGMKKGMKKGIKEGLEKGIKMGMEKGIKKGIKKGIEKEREVVVINCNNAGFSLEVISKITGLTIEEIQKILKKVK